MSIRSIILALLVAALVSALAYVYDNVIALGSLVPHQMPTVIYGGLIVLIGMINPLLKRIRPKWCLTGRELAVMGALGLLACSVPSWGLSQHLVPQLLVPHYQNRYDAVVRRSRAVEDVPVGLLTELGDRPEKAVDHFMTGMAKGEEHIPPERVPWQHWRSPLTFWGPLIFAILAAMLGLAVVLHHQWSRREHLAYPISRFADSLLPRGRDSVGRIFRERSFWVSTIVIASIAWIRYGNGNWPDVFIFTLPNQLDFSAFGTMFPLIRQGGEFLLFKPLILFIVIGLAYLLPSTVSFSLSVVPWIFCLLSGILLSYGIALNEGQHVTGKVQSFAFAGGYFGILLMMLYTGRRYYASVLCRSFLIPFGGQPERASIWGMRIFIVGAASFIVMLVCIGLPWYAAVMYVGLTVMIFTVVSRVVAEAGVFHIGTELVPGAIIAGFLGASALGPQAIVIMSMVSGVMLMAPGWGAMPFAIQGLKLTEMSKVNVARPAKWGLPILLIGMVIAIPVTIYWQYDRGLIGSWPRMASEFTMKHVANMKKEIEADELASLSQQVKTGLAAFEPDSFRVTVFVIAAALAITVGLANLRFPWWPLHPVMFVFLGGYQAQWMWFSCLIGWSIKSAVMRFGGGKYYERTKPLMMGLIAGDVLGALVPMIINGGYYMVTGTRLVAGGH